MKAVLEFTLPMEAAEHHAALHGMAYKSGLDSIRMELRGLTKHGHKFKTADQALEHINKFVIDVINEADASEY
jgi:hypothetical protein